jgi:hypothetical protein
MSGQFVGAWGGFLMSVIAFSIVFLVIAVLMVMMMLLKRMAGYIDWVNSVIEALKSASRPAGAPARGVDASIAGKGEPGAESVPAASDDELVAVLTAAITASLGAGVRVLGFTQVSARSGSSAWRINGRIQNLEGFVE